MEVRIEQSWKRALGGEFDKEYFRALSAELHRRKAAGEVIYPAGKDIFRAFDLCPLQEVKVVILGQDPYHGPNQAHGLCFSVKRGIEPPPSLKNIYKEMHSDIGTEIPSTGDLTCLAKQGVLLLNTVLTVRAGMADSHKDKGWEIFTDNIIRKLNERPQPIVFILWGANAKSKEALITDKKHFIIKSAHPSPLSAYNGFFGSRPFSAANNFLVSHGLEPVDWKIGDLD